MVTWSKFYEFIEDLKILGATIHNLFAMATCVWDFCTHNSMFFVKFIWGLLNVPDCTLLSGVIIFD
jgi:hypothetical protein